MEYDFVVKEIGDCLYNCMRLVVETKKQQLIGTSKGERKFRYLSRLLSNQNIKFRTVYRNLNTNKVVEIENTEILPIIS